MSDLESARHEAVRALCRAQADDRLSLESFESRLAQIKQATNRPTLNAILADLEDTTHLPAPVTTGDYVAPADHFYPAPVAPAEYLRLASVFGSSKRAGGWTVPLHIDAYVLFGELTIDLRDAVFASDIVDIDVNVKLGSFTLIVPQGTQVENEIHEIMSASTHSTRRGRGPGPNGLLVRLRGKAVAASVDLKEKPPTGQGDLAGVFKRLIGKGE